MSIENPAKYVSTLPDWECLEECFEGNIRPTDIDGAVERKRCFLFCECKSEGASIPVGQDRFFKALASHRGFTVIYIWNYPNPTKLRWLGAGEDVTSPGSMELLQKWCEHWSEHANSRPERDIPPPPTKGTR
jgi:hypothetical protein